MDDVNSILTSDDIGQTYNEIEVVENQDIPFNESAMIGLGVSGTFVLLSIGIGVGIKILKSI